MLTWLWPEACAGCGTEGEALCAVCTPGSWLRPRPRSEGVEAAAALVRYTDPLGQQLRRAKVDADRALAGRLAGVWASRLSELVPRGSV
ncbi:MAG: hypothetical protein KC656_17315, partial [Myxococcales bacterium]|nr:hypothetical protein [Myxococcales bacterium]